MANNDIDIDIEIEIESDENIYPTNFEYFYLLDFEEKPPTLYEKFVSSFKKICAYISSRLGSCTVILAILFIIALLIILPLALIINPISLLSLSFYQF